MRVGQNSVLVGLWLVGSTSIRDLKLIAIARKDHIQACPKFVHNF